MMDVTKESKAAKKNRQRREKKAAAKQDSKPDGNRLLESLGYSIVDTTVPPSSSPVSPSSLADSADSLGTSPVKVRTRIP